MSETSGASNSTPELEARTPRTIAHVISGDLWGGSEAQMGMQLAALREQGVDVRVILFNEGEVRRRYEALGIPCLLAEERGGFRNCFRVLRRHLRDLHPGVLVSHGYKENILSSLCSVLYGIPWIPVFHGFRETFSGMQASKAWIYYQLSEWAARFRACRIITVSKKLAEQLGFARDGRLRVVRNVVSIAGSASAVGTMDNRPVAGKFIAAVGRLVPIKRIDLLLGAFSKCDTAEVALVIVGDGPLRAELESQAANLGIQARCHFLGFRADAVHLIEAAEVFVMCSDNEGLPTVLLEAISFGKKAVVTRVGGIPEVVSLFEGYPIEMVEPNDQDALTRAIGRSINSTAAAPSATRQILEENFSPRVAADAHAALYRELVRAD